jgi:predicted Zn finger-like uncharacterized protein
MKSKKEWVAKSAPPKNTAAPDAVQAVFAARCTSCQTVFKVKQEQLKASDGWVRCGRCNEVFLALDELVDVGSVSQAPSAVVKSDAPAVTAPVAPLVATTQHDAQHIDMASLLRRRSDFAPLAETTEAPPSPAASKPQLKDKPAKRKLAKTAKESSLRDKIDSQLMGSTFDEGDFTPANRVRERDRLEFPDAQFHTDPTPFEEETDEALQSVEADIQPEATTEGVGTNNAAPPLVTDAITPEFIRRAQAQARWQSPKRRAALLGLALVLVAALALQAALHFRDTLAARWPATQPALTAWCQWVACKVEVPRRIEDISVENSALVRAPQPNAFKLVLSLRNRGGAVVATPSIELSLTDATGQLIARRILSPADFADTPASIPAGGDLPLQLTLTAGEVQVSGYTIEVFYP